MKTTYYTFIIWNEGSMASGGGAAPGSRQCAMIRQPSAPVRRSGGGKIIELDVWRTADPEAHQAEEPDLTIEEPGTAEAAVLRPRRKHHWLRALRSWLPFWRRS